MMLEPGRSTHKSREIGVQASDEVMQILEAFRAAYNSVDIAALEALVAEDVRWEHHNRFKGTGRAPLMQSILDFAERMPGRYFDPPTRVAVNGQTVFVERKWRATPVRSDAAWGWEAGVPTSMDTCSVYVIDAGKIVEWGDYG